MVNYKQFAVTDDVAFNVLNALEYCKAHGENGLLFDKAEYKIYGEKAAEGVFSMSNHSDPGFKRALFLLDGFENFTIDGGGSHFVFEDIMTPFILTECKNITLQNFSIEAKKTLNAQFRVVRSGEDWFDLKPEFGKPFVHGGDLYEGIPKIEFAKLVYFDIYDENCCMTAGDFFFAGSEKERICYSMTEDGLIHGENVPRCISVGSKLVMQSRSRCMASIFVNRSVHTTVKNVTIHSGIGMGLIAQNSEDVELEGFNLRQLPGRCYAINADATHFVHCKGDIYVHDCFFEGQMDDALNIHSIYLKIIGKQKNKLMVKYMHYEQKGIDIISVGDTIETAPQDTLISSGTYTVTGVRKINLDVTELTVAESVEAVRVGDVVNEISWVPSVRFQNCTVRNNRARGMLLAAPGKIVISDNLFQTPGPAIKFESDGKFWYESGGTKDVLITQNRFDRCVYCGFGYSVIEFVSREKTEQGKYYHKKIAVEKNIFQNCMGYLAIANNIEQLAFQDNIVENCEKECIVVQHCDTVQSDLKQVDKWSV